MSSLLSYEIGFLRAPSLECIDEVLQVLHFSCVNSDEVRRKYVLRFPDDFADTASYGPVIVRVAREEFHGRPSFVERHIKQPLRGLAQVFSKQLPPVSAENIAAAVAAGVQTEGQLECFGRQGCFNAYVTTVHLAGVAESYAYSVLTKQRVEPNRIIKIPR